MDSIYQQILVWTENKPDWLRDALRRLVEAELLTDEDKDELFALCASAHQVAHEYGDITPDPLNEDHIPHVEQGQQTVQVLGIGQPVGINKLDSEASVEFAPEGLTVIYGDNGAGKSGYMRVLKKVCRSRGRAGDIYSDVFTDDGSAEQSATINLQEGGDAVEYTWTPESVPPPALSTVSVFDSQCAFAHVAETNDLAYQPFGLDLLTSLANVAAELNTRFRRAQELEEAGHDRFDDFSPESEVCKRLKDLSKIKEEDVESTFSFTDENRQRLTALEKELHTLQASDPSKEIQHLRYQNTRLSQLREHLLILKKLFSNESLDEVFALKADRDTKQQGVVLAGKELEGSPISGTGGESWKILWEAARRFHKHEAYPAKDFPVDDDVHCVLCQQPLSEEARERMSGFEAFIQTDVQQQYRAATEALNRKTHTLTVAPLPEHMKTLIDELKGLDEEMAAKVEKFISEARTRQNTSISLSSLPCGYITVDWDESVIGEMETVAMAQVQKKINQFEELLRGKKPTEPIEKEISELRDLQKAFQNHDRIRNEIRRIKKVEALGECVRDTDTARITRKSGELSSVVTEALRESFSREVSALNVGRDLNISLEGRGASRGVARHQILLASSLQNVPVNEVLSEGEHRAIALSAFLTEVSLLTVNSGVVFDDPVSSLDHKRKSKIAKRLVEEAMRRQVVVFTHDLPFALELRRFAEEGATTPLSFRHLMPPMGTRGAGRSAEGLPWEGLSPERRLRELRDRMSRATAEYNAGNNELYNTMIVDIYRDLRITWERAVEEVLFYGVIKRFGRSVQTQKLSNVHITTEDNATVDRGMTKCSSFAHDPAIDDPPPVPEPDEVSGDIQSLQTWIETVKARRSS